MDDIEIETKICNECSIEKELKMFDGNRNKCRKCRNEKNTKSWLSKPGNIEHRRSYMKGYYALYKKKINN